MRDFFILWFERLITVIIVIAAAAVAVGSIVALVQQGILAFLAILIGGALYLVLFGGAMFLGLGIYQNTTTSAEMLEKIANK
jgi:hypothetical protein